MLEAALAARVAYIDVCDDADYSQRARGYHERAVAAGVPAITTAGIYPGVSNVRACLFAAFDSGSAWPQTGSVTEPSASGVMQFWLVAQKRVPVLPVTARGC